MIRITASIVIYNDSAESIKPIIKDIIKNQLLLKLYIVDNSSTISNEFNEIKTEYIFNNANLGYGKAHNIAIKKSIELQSDYHIVLNPDIRITEDTISVLADYMQAHQDAGLVMPKILYENGSLQYLCKLIPHPFDLIFRRFLPKFLTPFFKKRLEYYEFKNKNYHQIMEVPNLSGCFMFMRNSILKKVGIFDERYFMYLEDTDLCRRIGEVSKTVYNPNAIIYHGYAKESYKNFKLLKYHIISSVKYFNKWGWFFDSKRKFVNNKLK